MYAIRPCEDDEFDTVLSIVNDAAEVYRGVIPDDCWHEPYMSSAQLQRDMDAGVRMWGCESAGALVGVMGIQPVEDVLLIRHAYVRPASQRHGIGSRLLRALAEPRTERVLIGTWAAASWAIQFYQGHGFALLSQPEAMRLLRRYWSVPADQMSNSVVLSSLARAAA